jgi:hypothetical protein
VKVVHRSINQNNIYKIPFYKFITVFITSCKKEVNLMSLVGRNIALYLQKIGIQTSVIPHLYLEMDVICYLNIK